MPGAGPPYPHPNPAPGSNAIGSFVIGVSPIGTIRPFDEWSTVISQYANSQALTGIITGFADAADLTPEFDAFFDNVWNIATAQGFGLDIIGRRLDVSRILAVPAGDWLGFEEALTAQPFGQGTFFNGGGLTSNFALADAPYRLLLYAKALANICDGSAESINQILLALFPNRGNCYVKEGGLFTGGFLGFEESGDDGNPFGTAPFYSELQVPFMTITYVFQFTLSPVELAIVTSSGVLPKPVGVSARVIQI